MGTKNIQISRGLREVRYEIRGDLAHRARELEQKGYEVTHLNIGNPGRFGFRTPETMRLAMIENLAASEAYCHQKGIFPAREAVVMQQQDRGIMGVTAEDVFMGNGVSELIDLNLRALLNPGDEVLIPSPDYPLWTAAVVLNGGKAVHYRCLPENGFQPDLEHLASLISEKTRALVIINPNNPTGAVYDHGTLEAMAEMAEANDLVVFSDEIYDQVLYEGAQFTPMATLIRDSLCVTLSGLSKVYRACGYRVGWAIYSGNRNHSADFVSAVELLSSLRLCSNVPGQWAVQTALGGHQSIYALTRVDGRLYQSRKTVIERVKQSPYLDLVEPRGAIYAFPGIKPEVLGAISDSQFALDLLEKEHVLLAPGTSFNFGMQNHFRITFLPREQTMNDVFDRIDRLLEAYSGS